MPVRYALVVESSPICRVALAVFALSTAGCGPSALTPIAAGGSGQRPWVVATGTEVDNLTPRRTGQETRTEDKLYVFEPSGTDPARTFKAPPATSAIGAIGDRVWLMSGSEPFLIDAAAGKVVFAANDLGDRHAPLASGVVVSGHGHPDFIGPIHPETGDLGIVANGTKYVLTTGGSLVTFEDYLTSHPAELPKDLVCRGGRTRVCGSQACVKFVPDASGGERLEISASPLSPDALPKANSAPLFSPQWVADRGCVQRLGDSGPLVVTHQSKPGRNVARDQISAVDLAGETQWTVSYADLYGDRQRRSSIIDIVDDHVVTGVNVKSGLGVTIAVATIDASGTATPAP